MGKMNTIYLRSSSVCPVCLKYRKCANLLNCFINFYYNVVFQYSRTHIGDQMGSICSIIALVKIEKIFLMQKKQFDERLQNEERFNSILKHFLLKYLPSIKRNETKTYEYATTTRVAIKKKSVVDFILSDWFALDYNQIMIASTRFRGFYTLFSVFIITVIKTNIYSFIH